MTDPAKAYFGGVTAFLVEAGASGLEAGQKFDRMGLRTSPIGEIVFDNVHLPGNLVLGGVGGGTVVFSHSIEWERTCLMACHIGTMVKNAGASG